MIGARGQAAPELVAQELDPDTECVGQAISGGSTACCGVRGPGSLQRSAGLSIVHSIYNLARKR